MVLIIGGAYQGKLSFAQEKWDLSDQDVFTCAGDSIDFSKKCVDKIEEFTFSCIESKTNPKKYFKENCDLWKNSILICQDMSGGVVPLGADMREWRQNTGILCQYLAKEAESVYRIFCGLEQKLK